LKIGLYNPSFDLPIIKWEAPANEKEALVIKCFVGHMQAKCPASTLFQRIRIPGSSTSMTVSEFLRLVHSERTKLKEGKTSPVLQ
jgi:hypothetical protein